MALAVRQTEEEGGKKKPAGHKHSYTPAQIAELQRCMADPIYFIEKYVKIVSGGKLVPFILYDFQKRMIRNYLANDRIISMCPRQVGKTEATSAFLLWWACFKRNQYVFIASRIGDDAAETIYRIKSMYDELPWWIKPGLKKDNVMSIWFDNGGRIVASTTTPNTGRGRPIQLLYLDEFAYVDPGIQDRFYEAIQPTLSNGGRLIITSTPNTDEDNFAQIWFNAKDCADGPWVDGPDWARENVPEEDDYETIYETGAPGEFDDPTAEKEKKHPLEGFVRFYVKWNEHPKRDEAFKRRNLADPAMTFAKWQRQYECKFVSGDATLIEPVKLLSLNQFVKKPRFVDRHGTRWFRDIEPNTAYAVAMDPSEGVEQDNAVIQVWSLPDLKQVAEWASNEADQVEQTRMLVRMLVKIHNAIDDDPEQRTVPEIYYTVECNGIGKGIITALEMEGLDKFPGDMVDSENNKSRGIRTTEPSKREYSLQLKTLLERGIFRPASKELLAELKNYVKRGKTYDAKPGSKKDRIMSCVIMLHMIEEVKFQMDGIEEQMHVPIADEEEDDEGGDYEPLGAIV